MIQGIVLDRLDDELQVHLIDRFSDMVTEFTIPTDNLIDLNYSKLMTKNSEKYGTLLKVEPYIEEMLDFFIRVYLADYEFETPFSSILIINEELTVFIMKFLHKELGSLPDKSKQVFDAMHSIAGHKYSFDVTKFEKMSERINEKILLRLACSKTYAPSTTRYIYNDEYLGFISHVVSAAFPLLFYTLSSKTLLNLAGDKDQQAWCDICMVFIEIWLLNNWRLVFGRIKKHFTKNICEKDDDWSFADI